MVPLLQINNLSVDFKDEAGCVKAVDDISFEIKPGQMLAIVGESGSGKTVTALSVLQLLPKQAGVKGEILFRGIKENPIDLATLSTKEINKIRGHKIAMIFQEPMTSLNPMYTCGFQVMESILQHKKISKKEARQQAINLFTQVELPTPETMLGRYPHQISGGQKQRVMIAMAMSCGPSLLIADEPTTALDVRVQKNILELIKTLQQKNEMAVLLITHDLGLVADVADEVAIMYKGKIVEQGNANEILLNPQHAYTKALLACRPAANAKGKRLSIVSDFLEEIDTLNSIQSSQVLSSCISDREASVLLPLSLGEEVGGEVLLSVQNLKVYFPATKNIFGKPTSYYKAVDDVSFTVNQNEIVGLVGESGCGKTTLGRAILQLIKPTSGKIILNGKDITHIPENELRKMRKDLQIVFQDPYGSLNPRLTIGDAILEPLKVHGMYGNNNQRKEKVIELLEQVNLNAAHFRRYPHQFSGGQRQRICIARALSLNPSFLIFDESVSALDISIQAQILNLLNELKAKFNFTSIFISHDLGVVHYISDRILVMNKGKIVEEGRPDEIYYNPQNEYTQRLIEAIPGKRVL